MSFSFSVTLQLKYEDNQCSFNLSGPVDNNLACDQSYDLSSAVRLISLNTTEASLSGQPRKANTASATRARAVGQGKALRVSSASRSLGV